MRVRFGWPVAALLVGFVVVVPGCSGGGASASMDDAAADGDAGADTMDSTGTTDSTNDGASDAGAELDADATPIQRRGAYECMRDPACERLLVVAHRGDHERFPENSLAGLRGAVELGVDLVEIDVRHTADDVLVLMHDGDLDRTTDATGAVSDRTWAELAEVTLNHDPSMLDGAATDGGTGNGVVHEVTKIPRFSDALELARELGTVLYVDQKTGRNDLMVAAIAAGGYHEQVLLRAGISDVAESWQADNALLVMPPLSTTVELELAQEAIGDLHIVELSRAGPEPKLTAELRAGTASAEGVKVQQDVMASGDTLVLLNDDRSGWAKFVDAGVQVLQTDLPIELLAAVREYEATGVFPAP